MVELAASIFKWLFGKLGLLLVVLLLLVAAAAVQAFMNDPDRPGRNIEILEAAKSQRVTDLENIRNQIRILSVREESQVRSCYVGVEILEKMTDGLEAVSSSAKAELDGFIDSSSKRDWITPAYHAKRRALKAAHREAEGKLSKAHDQTEGKRQDCEQLAIASTPELKDLAGERIRTEAEIDEINHALDREIKRRDADWRERLFSVVEENLYIALWIVGSVIAVPLAIKTLLYHYIAPIVSRLPPVRIIPDDNAVTIPQPGPSAVSVEVDVEPGDELLLKPAFLQSSSQPSLKKTEWLLNSRIPFTSIASGMFALTKICPESDIATRVVVSPRHHVLGKVGIIEIPDGACLVAHPRALAGVVKLQGKPVRIARYWRLRSLHSWLTLQLRYLVFHGPCKLIINGSRGIRAEEPDPAQPRLISRSATLGFSANLEYATVRCETFVPYIFGSDDLFNDSFSRGPGFFIYEEFPSGGGGDGRGGAGKGMEGLMDGVLKTFGI